MTAFSSAKQVKGTEKVAERTFSEYIIVSIERIHGGDTETRALKNRNTVDIRSNIFLGTREAPHEYAVKAFVVRI